MPERILLVGGPYDGRFPLIAEGDAYVIDRPAMYRRDGTSYGGLAVFRYQEDGDRTADQPISLQGRRFTT